MRMFVANCTRQNQEIYYRLDFNENGERQGNTFAPAKKQTIPPGRQIPLGGDLHKSQIDDIIAQLTPFGLVGTVDVPRLKDAKVTPYVFDIDKPVSASVIRDVIARNNGVHREIGAQRRAQAAVVVDKTVADTVANEFAATGVPSEPVQDVEVEIEQEDAPAEGAEGPAIAEGFRVREQGAASPEALRAAGKGGNAKPAGRAGRRSNR